MLPFSIGICWQCGDTQGPWSLCEHPIYKTKIWLCELCEKKLETIIQENPFESENKQ